MLSKEEKQREIEIQHNRVKIRNIVSRKPEIDTSCCICGKPGNILHNPDDIYNISFICDECRKTPEKLEEAKNHRIDIRTKYNKTGLSTSNILDEEMKSIVEGYMDNKVITTIGEYCELNGISRHQFSKLLERYVNTYKNKRMLKLIKNKSDAIKRHKVREVKANKY